MSTSLAPVAVHALNNKDRLLGASIEGIIFNLIKQIEVINDFNQKYSQTSELLTN